MKLYLGVWLTIAISLGAVCVVYAVVVFPIGLVITAAFCGAMTAGTAAALASADSTERQLWGRCLRIARNGAGIVVAAMGMVYGSGWSGLLLILLMAAASPATLRWAARRLGSSISPADRAGAVPQVGSSCLAWGSPALMTDHQLSFTWRLSWLQVGLANSPRELLQLVEHRSALLDEMHQRDPEGFGRWLLTVPHPASDPYRI